MNIDQALMIYEGTVIDQAFMAEALLWLGDPRAIEHARAASDGVTGSGNKRLSARVCRLEATALLAAADGSASLEAAEEPLREALILARAIGLTEEELPALIGLAELRRRQGRLEEARDQLDQAWELLERGPYRLMRADACNALAQIERDAGRREEALGAAQEAYRAAWCDGWPFSYQRGLAVATGHLEAVGGDSPADLEPFSPGWFEPFPDVEIDVADEYGIE
jgi:tetratricopeptide (TPR) repeat protein